MHKYDLIVIGGGAAGLNVSIPMARLGLDVLLIEQDEEKLGGECLNSGCVPSKTILNIAEKIHTARETQQYGLNISGQVDYSTVKQELDRVRNQIGEKEDDLLDHDNIDIVFGEARFTGDRIVDVNGTFYTAKNVVLATGSTPRRLTIPGSEAVDMLSYEDLFELEEQPDTLLVIGGGPVGTEMAQAFNRLGIDVVIVERNEEILYKEDPEIAATLRENLEEEGVKILRNAETQEFKDENTLVVNYDGKKAEITFDTVLVSIGKVHDYDSLSLQQTGVETNQNGKLEVDNYLRTTNKNIYACGDATGGYYFTHASEHEARTVIYNMISPWKTKISYDNLPWVTYTDPAIATFGKTQEKLDKEGREYEVLRNDFDDVNKADILNEKNLIQKLYVNNGNILGGTVLSPHAGEVIQELILAKQENIPLKKLTEKIYPYPTLTRVNRVTALEHLETSTPDWMKQILKLLY